MNYFRRIRVKGIHYNLPAGILFISAVGKLLLPNDAADPNGSKNSGSLALSYTSHCDSSESFKLPSKESPCVAYSYPANNPSEVSDFQILMQLHIGNMYFIAFSLYFRIDGI